jgi:hypothetical protein
MAHRERSSVGVAIGGGTHPETGEVGHTIAPRRIPFGPPGSRMGSTETECYHASTNEPRESGGTSPAAAESRSVAASRAIRSLRWALASACTVSEPHNLSQPEHGCQRPEAEITLAPAEPGSGPVAGRQRPKLRGRPSAAGGDLGMASPQPRGGGTRPREVTEAEPRPTRRRFGPEPRFCVKL